MKTNYDRLLTFHDKNTIRKAITVKSDKSAFSIKYVKSVDRIVKKMENDKDFTKEVKDLELHYEEEMQKIVNRWKVKNFKKVMNEELKKIEAGV